MRLLLLAVLLILMHPPRLGAQLNCRIVQKAFEDTEELHYEIYYHWGLIWMNAGEAKFSVKPASYASRKTLHFVGEGSTYKNYDWFYKVRDRFDTWSDTASLLPYRYIRSTKEGGTHVYNDNYFNYREKEVKCFSIQKGKVQTDSAVIKPCTFDVLSMIYYSRCIDYTGMKVNTKIPISIYLDGQIYDTLYIRYLGKEKIKTESGEKECIKFSPLLIKGTIFSGGEGMTVWVSNDEKKVPLLITTPIIVGEIQVKLKKIREK